MLQKNNHRSYIAFLIHIPYLTSHPIFPPFSNRDTYSITPTLYGHPRYYHDFLPECQYLTPP